MLYYKEVLYCSQFKQPSSHDIAYGMHCERTRRKVIHKRFSFL